MTWACPEACQQFIRRYDPVAADHGRYTHQSEVLRMLSSSGMHDIVLPPVAGWGKSRGRGTRRTLRRA